MKYREVMFGIYDYYKRYTFFSVVLIIKKQIRKNYVFCKDETCYPLLQYGLCSM